MNNNRQRRKILLFFLCILIFGIIMAYISLKSLRKFSLLGITPDNIGLRPDGSDLARVMYETGTLIVSFGALLVTALAFIVPFTVIMWSQMEDSYFSLFIETLGIKESLLCRQKKREFCNQIKKQIENFRGASNFGGVIFRATLLVSGGSLLGLAILSISGWPCWNISHYILIRGIFFVSLVILVILIGLLIVAFIFYKPEIWKGEKHLEIVTEVLKRFPDGKESQEK